MNASLKQQLRHAVRRFGYEIVPSGDVEGHAFVRHLSALFRKLDIRCVLDVGANRGQYRRLLRERVGYDGRIISFEPQSRNAAHLRDEARADPRWQIHDYALGSTDTRLDLNIMRADLLSSFLDPNPAMAPMFRDVNVIERKETVEVRRLDSIRGTLGGLENVFLKLDTQGFDLEVIRGALATLLTVRALQTEIAMQPLYRNAPSYQETLDALAALGFAVTAMAPVSRDELMRVIEFDCVLVNSVAAAV